MAFFTREQILEIATRLSQLGVSDQELEQADALTGSEQFAVIQEGTSKKTSVNAISSLISAAINSTELDIFNVTRYQMEQTASTEIIAMTFEEALTATPTTIKRVGQMITYYDSTINAWRMWRFIGVDVNSWYTTSSWEEFTAASSLATVASTGNYNDLLNKKTKVSELTNDSGYITNSALDDYYTKDTTDNTFATKTSLDNYATKTWVGDQGYKTTISWTDLTEDSGHQFVSSAEKTTWGSKQAAITNENKLSSTLISGLATVATSGNASDLTEDSTHKFVTETEIVEWSAKQDAITGAASTILNSNLTANKAVVVNSSGKLATSGVSTTELGRLEGVTANVQTQLNSKQATINDLAAIRSGAALGATAYQMGEDGIPAEDLEDDVQTSLALASNAYQKPSGGIPNTDLAGSIPATKLASAVQASLALADSAYQVPSGGIPSTDLSTAVQTSLSNADTAIQSISSVTDLIPSSATSSNKLVDASTLNSTVSTATATFRGTSEAGLTESQFTTWANGLTKDLNDYIYWNTTDASGNTVYKRYKYNGSAWAFEYSLNNSSFTTAQWSAINSGITTARVTEITEKYTKPSGGIPSSDMTTSVQTSLGKADTAYQKPVGGIPKSDLDSSVQASLELAGTCAQYTNVYTKTEVNTLLTPLAKTTVQIEAMDVRNLPIGTCVFNTTTGKPYWYNGSDWRNAENEANSHIIPDE